MLRLAFQSAAWKSPAASRCRSIHPTNQTMDPRQPPTSNTPGSGQGWISFFSWRRCFLALCSVFSLTGTVLGIPILFFRDTGEVEPSSPHDSNSKTNVNTSCLLQLRYCPAPPAGGARRGPWWEEEKEEQVTSGVSVLFTWPPGGAS